MNVVKRIQLGSTFIVCLMVLSITAAAQAASGDGPETVLATYRVKPDRLNDFLALMPDYWAALRSHGLVLAEPNIVLRGEENGKPIVVEVFSWKDHEAADHVPVDIQVYWSKLNSMVEARDGHLGIEFPEMSLVSLKKEK